MNFVEGVHPESGEILRVRVEGNFPYKDPETNKFIVDPEGKVVTPGRSRERFLRLDAARREIPDPRPMASAVAFAFDVTPEEEVRRLIASADARVAANYAKAEASDVEFFDDDDGDFETPGEGGVDNMQSPFEFVRDAVANMDVPRALQGSFIRTEKPPAEADDAKPLPPKGKAAKLAKKAANADSDSEPELPIGSANED